MSVTGEKMGEFVVSCHRCGGFLMESVVTTSYMVCPRCGVRLVAFVKNGKVTVTDDTRSDEELAKKKHDRLNKYADSIMKSQE